MAAADDSPPSDPNDPWIGQDLGGYTILRMIGAGGMGVVYLARHNSLDRLAAVKFLPAHMINDAAYVELFLREAKAAAKLSHPNIVGVHDAGSLGEGIYYFIMEYVEGESLGDMLDKRGNLPVPEAAEYVRQAASALAYAHKKSIIHRDIKPENLLLTAEGIIKVVDLGLAKWAGEESSMVTQTGEILGSPVYISPERLRDPHLSDPRTDIYSLGGTLFHLITGRIPYEGSSPVIMARHLTDPVPDPRESNPVLDLRISRIVMKMMAKEPKDRYQTMDEVEADLRDYLAGKEPSAGPIPARGGPSRKPAALLIAAGVVILALVGGLAYALLRKPPSAQAPAEKVEPPPAAAVKPPPEPEKPKEVPPPPHLAAKPVLLIADFNTDSRLHLRGGKFGAWNSSRPDPTGKASERVMRDGSHDGTGYWLIDFDIKVRGSYSGSWMEIPNLEVSKYEAIQFMAKSSEQDGMNFVAEVKTRVNNAEVVKRHIIREVGTQWKQVEIPLAPLGLPLGAVITGLNFVFDDPVTGARQGKVCVDDLKFVMKQ